MPETFSWALPPAPGQYGAPAPQEQQPPRADNPMARPYGFPQGSIGDVPPFNPYMPTSQNPALRDRPHTDWGTDDWVLAGMKNYPEGGTPDGMYVPTERDFPGIIHNLVTGIGQWAAPSVAMPMIQAGVQYNQRNANWQKGFVQQSQLNMQQMRASMELATYNHDLMIQQYKNAYAEYAPDKDGKGGEPEELANRLREIAIANNDHNMLHLLERGDMAGVDKLLKYLDSQGQDLKKAKELVDYEEAKAKLEETKRKAEREKEAERIRNIDPNKPPPAQPGQPAQPAAPEPGTPEPDQSDQPGQPEQPGKPGQPTPPSDTVPQAPDSPDLPELKDEQVAQQPQPARAAPQPQPRPQSGAPQPGAPAAAALGGLLPAAAAQQAPPAGQGGGWSFEPLDQPADQPAAAPVPGTPAAQDLRTTPAEPEEDKDYRPPKIVPLPPARDYPDLNLSAADIDARADIFAKTGKRQFVGGAGLEGEANQKREQVIEHRALQKNQYAQNVLKSIPKGHQEAVLGLLDPVMPGIAANVRAIVERRAPIPRGYAANSYYWNTIQETARRIAPKLTDNDYIQATRTRAAFQTGTAYPAQTRAATNRALQHAAYMVVLAQGLNNENMLMYNQAKNWMTTQFGGAGPTTFKAVLAHVAQELTKAFRGNSGALADVERELHNINENSSPTQIAGYLGAVGNLLYGQMDSLADLWNEGTNEHKHPLDMLSKAGQDAYLYLRKVDPGNYHPIMQSDGREGVSLSVDPADAARYARPHSWKLSDGTVITDYGSRYTNPPETVPIPIWPNYQPEAPNINIQQQEQ